MKERARERERVSESKRGGGDQREAERNTERESEREREGERKTERDLLPQRPPVSHFVRPPLHLYRRATVSLSIELNEFSI